MIDTELKAAAKDLRSRSAARRSRGVAAIRELQRRGDPTAAYAIGTWLLHGSHGYPRSEADAAPYLQYAADHHIRDAVFDLGVLVETSRLGDRSRREAFGRYVTAAVLGDRDAAYEVVRCIYHGIGAYADPRAAERLNDALNAGERQPAIAAE